jgi:ribosomal protein S18 acetylase RimI-like enzyme
MPDSRNGCIRITPKKRIGAALVLFCEDYCKKLLAELIWFNARTTAVGFYKKLGYQKTGMPFEIKEVGEHSLMFKKLDKLN